MWLCSAVANCWHRGTQMSGWCWQRPGSGEKISAHFERHHTPQGHLLFQSCQYQLSSRSAVAQILGLGDTRTLKHDSYPANTVGLISFLSPRSYVLGTDWPEHPWDLWHKKKKKSGQIKTQPRERGLMLPSWRNSSSWSPGNLVAGARDSPTLTRQMTTQQSNLLLMAASDEECCPALWWI